MIQSDLDFARKARDEGMQRSTDHADGDAPGWSDDALAFLKQYAEAHDQFVGWYVTKHAELSGKVAAPPTKKAWGSIFTKAQRLGWIEKNGYRQDPNRHANPCPVWASRICKVVLP